MDDLDGKAAPLSVVVRAAPTPPAGPPPPADRREERHSADTKQPGRELKQRRSNHGPDSGRRGVSRFGAAAPGAMLAGYSKEPQVSRFALRRVPTMQQRATQQLNMCGSLRRGFADALSCLLHHAVSR